MSLYKCYKEEHPLSPEDDRISTLVSALEEARRALEAAVQYYPTTKTRAALASIENALKP